MAAPLISRPALVVIDMQNDFVRAGAPMEVPSARAIVPPLLRLLTRFRERRQPVVYTRYVASDRYHRLSGRLAWLKLLDPPTYACMPGFSRTYDDISGPRQAIDIIDELRPDEGDTLVDKVYYSAFHGTDLHERLQALGVDGLVITGTLTEMCVEDTARHAVHFGYPTVLVSDCVASNDPERHEQTLENFHRSYGWSMTGDEVAALFAEAGSGPVSGP